VARSLPLEEAVEVVEKAETVGRVAVVEVEFQVE
jgi:hypothetical protein